MTHGAQPVYSLKMLGPTRGSNPDLAGNRVRQAPACYPLHQRGYIGFFHPTAQARQLREFFVDTSSSACVSSKLTQDASEAIP